jgi:hypothetical protein
MALTELKIRNAKSKDVPYRLADSGGLYLYVTPAGGKLWRWKYRFGGKEKLMSLGSYPEVSLAAARTAHLEHRIKLTAGTDPMAERKAQKTIQIRQVESSFEHVAGAWFRKWRHGKCQRHADYTERRMQADILPRLGSRPIDEIQPPDIVAMVQAIEERGATDVARRALQTTNQIFRYGLVLGLVKQNPAAAFRAGDVLPQKPVENFARLDKAEVPEVHGYDKTAVHGEYVKNLAVRKNIPLKALDELVHPDADLASVFLGYRKRFDMGIELTPLPGPIAADLFFSDNLAALRSLGPAHVFGHQCQCTVNVPLVEREVRLLNHGLSICHSSSYNSCHPLDFHYRASPRHSSVLKKRETMEHPQKSKSRVSGPTDSK